MLFRTLFLPKAYFPLVLIALLASPLKNIANPTTNTATISGEMKVWHKVTLAFQGPNTSESASTNPFLDYRLNVVFTHPDTSYTVPGFYAASGNAAEDGLASGDVWKVHFAPDRSGTWTYTASFRTGNNVAISDLANAGTSTHFDGETGNFTVFPSDKSYPDFRASGRLSYDGSRYWKHQGSGEYFLRGGLDSPENLLDYEDFDNTPNQGNMRKSYTPHLGDWNQGDPTWQGTKGKGLVGALNYLSNKGINVISFLTLGHLGDDENVFPWVNAGDPLVYDVSKLEQWEIIFEHADHKGIFLHFKTMETENDDYLDNGNLGTERKLYYRELIARYGHHLALNWNLGEESGQSTVNQQSYAQYFKDHDPYQHLLVIHTTSFAISSVMTPLLGSGSELTGFFNDTNWGNVHSVTDTWVESSENSGQPWCVVNTEQNPPLKGVLPDAGYQGYAGTTTPTTQDTRHSVLWGNLMAGGGGVEYYFGYGYAESDLTLQDFRSRDELYDYTTIALGFFRTYVPFWEMTNMDDKVGNPNHNNSVYCFGKQDDVYVVYLPNGGTIDLNLGNTNQNTYTVKWFNPRTGNGLEDGSVTTVSGTGSVNLGTPPGSASEDWVVLVNQPDPFTAKNYAAFCVTDSAKAAKLDALLIELGIVTTTSDCGSNNGGGCTTPNAEAGPNVALGCGQTSATLDGSSSDAGIYSWTGPNGFTSASVSPTVTATGIYYLTVSTGAGCSALDSVTVSQGSGQPPVADAGSNQLLDCNTNAVTLDGSNSDPGTYSWSGPNGFSSTLQSPIVSIPGTYTLTVTGNNGCQATDNVTVTSDPSQPTADAGANLIINCITTSVTLDGSNSSSGTYSWSGPNGFTSSSVSPTVTDPGNYTLTVTAGNGCSASDGVQVADETNAPIANAGSNQVLGCNTSVTLDASGSEPGSISWSGPNGFSSTQVTPTVSDAGTYVLTLTGSNGCVDTDNVTVTANTTLPKADAGVDLELDCTTNNATLDGTKSDPGTYSWTGPGGFTSSSLTPTVTQTGTYTLTVTASNGCTSSDDVVVGNCSLQCNGNAVTHFVLIDADTDLPILDPLPNNAVIDLSVVGNKLNIEAITTNCGTTVESVEMILTGPDNQSKTENKAPWALFGDKGGDFLNWNPDLGNYTLSGTPFSEKSGDGTAGTNLTINFSVIDNSILAKPGSTTSSIGNQAGQNQVLNVMPNPFQNQKFQVNLSGNYGQSLDIKLYNMSGQLVYQEQRPYTSNFEVDLTGKNISNGIYQLRINNKTKMIQKKGSN